MCNDLNQKIRQVAQWSPELIVQPLPTGVRRDLGGPTRQQPAQGLGSVTLQAEEVLELANHSLDDLALALEPVLQGSRCSR
jgi:hypothetical protein